MNKICRRVLSVFLSALMVVTMLPFAAVTAYAKNEEATSFAYLTDASSLTRVFGNDTGVTWNSTEKAAYFDGSHGLTLAFDNTDNNPYNDNPFTNSPTTTPFAISFDFKKTSSNPHWGFVFQLDNGSNDKRFGYNGGSNTDSEWDRGIVFAKFDNNGANNGLCSYYSQDMGAEGKVSDGTVASGGTSWKPDNDTWYNISLYMGTDNKFYYYVNGTLYGTFLKPSGGDKTNAQLAAHMIDYTKLNIGRTAAGDYFNGYIKNVQIYSYENSAVSLKTAMDAYEAKMADGKVYTNLKAAYDAYREVSAKYDAYLYGEASASDNATAFNNAANNLAICTGAMQPWTRATFNAEAYHYDDTATGGYSNVVYCSKGDSGMFVAQSGNDPYEAGATYVKLFVPSTVVLAYDGVNTVASPIVAETKIHDKAAVSKQKISYIASKNATVYFDSQWDGFHESQWKTWPTTTTNHFGYRTSDGTSNQYDARNSTSRFWRNKLVYHITTPDTTNYYSTYSNIKFEAGAYYDNWGDKFGTKEIPVTDTNYVINYAPIIDAVPEYRSYLDDAFSNGKTVADYKEGGLASLLTAVDVVTGDTVNPNKYSYSNVASDVSTCAEAIKNAVTNNSYTAPVTDSNYSVLKTAIDASRQIPASTGETFTPTSAYGNGTNEAGFTPSTWSTFKTAYEDARDAMEALYDKTVYPSDSASVSSISSTANALTTAFNGLILANITGASFSPASGYIGYNGTSANTADLITIENNEAANSGSVAYTITYNDSSTADGNIAAGVERTTVNPFTISGHENATTATISAVASKVVGNDTLTKTTTSETYTNVKAPTVNDLVVAKDAHISATSNNSPAGTVQFSTNGTDGWTAATSFTPFTDGSNSTITVYSREKITSGGNNYYSKVNSYALVRKGGELDVIASVDGGTSSSEFNGTSTFTIPNASSYSGTIKYKVYIDGVEDNTERTYNGAFSIGTANFVKFIVWAEGASGQTTETEMFNRDTYNPLAYQESFTGATVSGGNTLTSNSPKGINATAAGTISVVKGAGTKVASNNTGEMSNSWRSNVLKIEANGTAPGPVVTLASNPLATNVNKVAAKSQGVTICFWRHMENDTTGATEGIGTTQWNDTGYNWRNAIAFQKNGDNSTYYIIEVNGVNSRCIDNNNFTDFVPFNQDNTGHEEGNDNGEWEHVAVTIHPTEGIKVYTNGVEHDTKYVTVKKNGTTTTTTTTDHDNPLDTKTATAESAAEIIDFLTSSTTQMTFDNGVTHEGNPLDLFLDDIRVYTRSMTQVEINNMFTDDNADVKATITSTSHDPSNVTVYTVAAGTYSHPGSNETYVVESPKKVGQEFIDYYNVDVSNKNVVTAVEYYSFGTGMTVYKAHTEEQTSAGDKYFKWEVLGDSEGRCGYQNEDLFSAKYTTALSEVRAYFNVDTSKEPSADEAVYSGAGYLVWAPHVMYNLTEQKWVYYAAMSSWGATKSVTFYATSENPESGYTYRGIIYKSDAYQPNAIDICPFYEYNNATNSPKKEYLYMVIGSWGTQHAGGRYDAIYGMMINADGSAPDALKNTTDGLENPSAFNTNNPGLTCYALIRGHTPDLEGGGENGHNGSGEGAYVQYINGYYYLFVSYGQNTGSYTERVFRSTTPMGTDNSGSKDSRYTEYAGTNGFQANNDRTAEQMAQDGITYPNTVRGNQILAPFDISIYKKSYRSTGHNSVYKAINDYGESVYVNAAQARPWTSYVHDWAPVQDSVLAKRQSYVRGNTCLNNMIGVTENGWLVMFPYQYNGTDTVYEAVSASQLEGLYSGNNMRMQVDSKWSAEYQYTYLANPSDNTNTTGTVYGVRADNSEFKMKFKLVRDANGDKVQYIRLYNDSATFTQVLNDSVNPTHEGIIGVHTKAGKKIYMMATLNINQSDSLCGLQYWAYRAADVPDVADVVSNGDQVAMDGVIYTHATDEEVLALATVDRSTYYTSATDTYDETAFKNAQKYAIAHASEINTSSLTSEKITSARNSAYAVYGQEISDNADYGKKDANGYYTSGGERFTTITTKYPNYIEIDPVTNKSTVGSIISLDDTEYCREYGETGSSMYVVPIPMEVNNVDKTGYWCTKSGVTYSPLYTDDELAAAIADTTGANASVTTEWAKENLYKVYLIKGKVSTFFRYYDNQRDGKNELRNGYPEVGVTLVVAYKDAETGKKFSEFEFCYVMPNPAWAHTLAATKNTNTDTGNSRESSLGIFNRFLESSGGSTEYSSAMLRYASMGNVDDKSGWGDGVSSYLSNFSKLQSADSSNTATYKELNDLSKIKTLFNFYDKSIGDNSGSFAAWTHNDKGPNAYTATPQVVNTNYYVDYSDTSNYLSNNPETGIITTNNGVPTGYQFKMRTSNFLWQNYENASIFDVTSYAMNTTGLNVTYTTDSTLDSTYNSEYDVEKYDRSHTNVGNQTTNYSYFGTINMGAGKPKRWFDTDMLFATDMRGSDNSYYFNQDYRNKLLYYFSDRDANHINYLKRDTVSDSAATVWHKGSDYVDGTKWDQEHSATMIWNYYDYSNTSNGNQAIGSTAYRRGPNGKGNTNTWQGTATFTGKGRVTQKTLADVKAIGDASSSDTLVFNTSKNRLHDGYWYKYTDSDKHEHEGWSATEPTSGYTSKGNLDVTAENLANYVLEIGTYHKIDDAGVGGGYFLGNETYHYYNIGVATCDKGAARDFLEEFELKELVKDSNGKVELDEFGRPRVDTSKNNGTGDIDVNTISVASYDDYIQAIARLEWFVKNPQNTLQTDLADVDKYSDVASVMTANDEYRTAYNSSGKPYFIVADSEAKTIFNNGTTDTSTTKTDVVQAKLIQDVIKAYEDLFHVEDYAEVERTYREHYVELSSIEDDAYTDTSVSEYNQILTLFKNECAYYTDEQNKSDHEALYGDGHLDDFDDIDENYWRNVKLTGAEYEEILDVLNSLDNVLMLKVDENGTAVSGSNINGAISDSLTTLEGGIFSEGRQAYTLASWLDMNDLRESAITLAEEKADSPRFTDEEKTLKFSSQTVTYHLPTETLSADQLAVNNKTTALNAAALTALDTTKYATYDSAYTVVKDAVNYDKYKPEALALINPELAKNCSNSAAINETVYANPTAAQVTAYNAKVGADSISTSSKLANVENSYHDGDGVDYFTSTLLSVANTIEAPANIDTYVKKFTGTVRVTDAAGEAIDAYDLQNASPYTKTLTNSARSNSEYFYYGDTFEVPIPEIAQSNCAISITSRDPYSETPSAAVKSQKVSYNGESFSKKAINNIEVTIKVTNKAPSDGYYKVQIKNIYGAVIDTIHVTETNLNNLLNAANWRTTATLNFTSTTVDPPAVPFYTFSRWDCIKNDTEKTAAFTPLYNAGQKVTLHINGADKDGVTGAALKSGESTTYETTYDSYVSITKTGAYGWATYANDKYQIAAYGNTVNLYAVTEETFYPIYQSGTEGNYTYTVNGDTLTASNVDVQFTVTDATADSLLKQKLDNKKPFVTLIAVDTVTNGNSKFSSATGYCRVTTGAQVQPYSEIGVVSTTKTALWTEDKMVKGSASLFKTSTVLSTGQYTYTLTASGSGFAQIAFRGYIAYDLDYSAAGTTATLNVDEYSSRIIEKRPTA